MKVSLMQYPSQQKTDALYDSLVSAPLGLTNLFSAAGSGKTHAIKKLIHANLTPILVISPYRVARDDYASAGAGYKRTLSLVQSVEKSFIYTEQLLTFITNYADNNNLDVTCPTTAKLAATEFFIANKNLKVVFDEYDSCLVQARMHTYKYKLNEQLHSISDFSNILIAFNFYLSKLLSVITVSATKDSRTTNPVIVPLGTTVRMPVINNYLMPNAPHSQVIDHIDSIISNAVELGRPVLVYSSTYSDEYYGLMNKLAEYGLNVLLLTRNERLNKITDAITKVMQYSHEKYNFIKFDNKNLTNLTLVKKANVMVVENAEEELNNLSTLHNQFQVIFITQSHSRVVSIHRDNLDNYKDVDFAEVITISSDNNTSARLSNSQLQAPPRFRDIPVIVHNFIKGNYLIESVNNMEGDNGYKYIAETLVNIQEYGIEEINCFWNPKKRPSTKGKAISPLTIQKNTIFTEFLDTNPTGNDNQKYKLYLSFMVQYPDVKALSRQGFINKLNK